MSQMMTSTEELIGIATIRKSENQDRKKTDQDDGLFSFQLFEELFLDICFFFKQYQKIDTIIKVTGVDHQEMVQKRLKDLLDAIENYLQEMEGAEQRLLDKLDTKDKDGITTASFICSSIELQKSDAPLLNQILSVFSKASDQQQYDMLEGLKYGRHPSIGPKLSLLKHLIGSDIKDELQAALEFQLTHYS